MFRNTLHYGDNLDVMREFIPDESVDLVYLDPPFNSARDYNVLFKQSKRDENQAQITAFTDTWQWSKRHYQEFFDEGRNARLFDLMSALHKILGNSEMMAYLVMMAPRLLELHRVIKSTGSLYLHCDPVASHYLKLVLDAVFGPGRFRNEVVWKRTTAHSGAKKWGRVHDLLLFYTKSDGFAWNEVMIDYSDDYMSVKYCHTDERGTYRLSDLTGAGVTAGDSCLPWRDYAPAAIGRHWAVPSVSLRAILGFEAPRTMTTQQKLDLLLEHGYVYIGEKGRGGDVAFPQYKRYLTGGVPIQDVITDINPINSQAAERLGYPTQKPLALLERIISASSNPGDVVFDPFCGCGTAVVAAEKLGRQWIGIDITYIALDLMINRLTGDFELKRGVDYDVKGDPKDAYTASKLFQQSPKQFEIWAVGLANGVPQPGKTGDKGIDGKVYLQDLEGNLQCAVCQVKGGHLTPSLIRDFSHVIEREKAAMGYFICLEKPTKGMYNEAEEIGFFDSPSGRKIPKLQIRTIKELLDKGNDFDFPIGYSLKSASGKRLTRDKEQGKLEM